jgi:hypothetical protein
VVIDVIQKTDTPLLQRRVFLGLQERDRSGCLAFHSKNALFLFLSKENPKPFQLLLASSLKTEIVESSSCTEGWPLAMSFQYVH